MAGASLKAASCQEERTGGVERINSSVQDMLSLESVQQE